MAQVSAPGSGLNPHVVNRAALVELAHGQGPLSDLAARAVATFDHLAIPDGTPFALPDHGDPRPVSDINDYLVSAVRHRAIGTVTARSTNYHLLRALRFLRDRHSDLEVSQGLRLSDASTADLVAYRDYRRRSISARSWNTELAALSGFFDWARANGIVERNPVPKWGARQRSTLKEREELLVEPRYLSEAPLRAFLEIGLRGDGGPGPAFGERDYAFGLTLVSTGLRREEAVLLLDAEVPVLAEMPVDGVHEFTRYGKYGRPRRVYVTSELAQVVDLYRATTRRHIAPPGR